MEYHSGGSLPLLGRPRYCPGAKANGGYLCETGHCCGETGCCTYYYELWWFWLLWTVLILFSCCCAYRHRRAKLRVQQQQQQQRESSLLAYQRASSYPSSMLDLSFLASLKLPSYEEVAAQPSTPPPPYSSVFTTPRYPQPPRTSEPHLLTQHHGPLLHRRLSDGPSSFSSDNSSSCSCDSCCPSSLCSSSISVPVTYETDTSHATTPSEATPLTLDLKVEVVAAANCPGRTDRFVLEAGSGSADVSDEEASGVSDPHRPPSATAPTRSQRHGDPTAAPHSAHACSPGVPPASVLIQMKSAEDPSEVPPPAEAPPPGGAPPEAPAGKVPSMSGPSSPTFSPPDSRSHPLRLDLSRTVSRCSLSPGPVSEPHPENGGASALTAGSPGRPLSDSALVSLDHLGPPSDPHPCPDPAGLNLGQAPILGSSGFSTMTNLPSAPEEAWSSTLPTQDPDPAGPHGSPQTSLDPSGTAAGASEPALTSPSSSWYQSPDLASDSLLVPEAPNPGPCPGPASSPNGSAAQSGPFLLKSPPCLLVPPPPNVQQGCSSGPEPGCLPVVDSGSGPLSSSVPALESRPAITIETVFSPPSPPAITSSSLPTTILLLDPLSVPHQASRGGSSSGHASSLSPSPRSTQSPPKQTLFSPCVDVFEPEPLSWEDGEEEQEEEENEENEEEEEDEEDVGADESQYRHRRLTGDSGIEVCRCRVDEEGEGEGEELEGKECKSRRVHGEGYGKGRARPRLHDSMDCPARSHREEGHTPTRAPTAEGGDKAAIAMETV